MSLIRKLDPRHWRYVRRVFDSIRAEYFTVNADGVQQYEVDLTIEELRATLGRRYFTNSWELSYQYKGEDLNMRRPEYVDDEYNWYQLHVRAFERDDGTVGIHAHLELEPTEHPHEHIMETNFDAQKGADMLAEVLDEAGVEYRKV